MKKRYILRIVLSIILGLIFGLVLFASDSSSDQQKSLNDQRWYSYIDGGLLHYSDGQYDAAMRSFLFAKRDKTTPELENLIQFTQKKIDWISMGSDFNLRTDVDGGYSGIKWNTNLEDIARPLNKAYEFFRHCGDKPSEFEGSLFPFITKGDATIREIDIPQFDNMYMRRAIKTEDKIRTYPDFCLESRPDYGYYCFLKDKFCSYYFELQDTDFDIYSKKVSDFYGIKPVNSERILDTMPYGADDVNWGYINSHPEEQKKHIKISEWDKGQTRIILMKDKDNKLKIYYFNRPILKSLLEENSKAINDFKKEKEDTKNYYEQQKKSANKDLAPAFKLSWGYGGGGYQESGAAAGNEGAAYVLYISYKQNVIEKFDSNGKYMLQWGGKGQDNGQFNDPCGMAVDNTGAVFVADSGNNRIQRFNPGGKYVGKWGDSAPNTGTGKGQFNDPFAVAADNKGSIYVVDRGNNRVQKFYSDGVFILEWGKKGDGDGQFDKPSGIAVDYDGFVYVADTNNSRIQKFDPNGKYLQKWNLKTDGITGGNGKYNSPGSIAVDENNIVYVGIDVYEREPRAGSGRVVKFTTSGKIINWDKTRESAEDYIIRKAQDPGILSVNKLGDIFAVEFGRSAMEKFDSSGQFMSQWGSYSAADGQFNYVSAVAVDNHSNTYTVIYVSDCFNNRIQKFDSNGNYILQWGARGQKDGQFVHPGNMAIDKKGNVYVIDSGNKRVQEFTGTGGFINKMGNKEGAWSGADYEEGHFEGPSGIVIDNEGNVLVSDITRRIEKFDPDGKFLAQFQIDFRRLSAIDNKKNLFISEGNDVIKTDPTGKTLLKLGCCDFKQGRSDSDFTNPSGIAVDKNGFIYVAGNSRVAKFSSDGKLITQWGGYGHDFGQFYDSDSIEIAVDDKENAVYVADGFNNRIQKFVY